MTCEEAQQQILAADNLSDPAQFSPELRAHLAACPQCQTLLAQLSRMEAAARTLPLPPNAFHPSPAFLDRVEKIGFSRRSMAQVWVRRAIAAAVIIAVGLAAASILTESKPARADEILKELVVWNLQISSIHDAAARNRIYSEKAQQLQHEVDAARLAPEDRAVAEHLLSNAKQLTTTADPEVESKNFSEIADELLARQKAPSNAPIAHQLEQLRLDIVNHGVNHTSDSPQQQPSTPAKPATTSAVPSASLSPTSPRIVAQGSFSFVPTYTPLLVKSSSSALSNSFSAALAAGAIATSNQVAKPGTFVTPRTKPDGDSDRSGNAYNNDDSLPRTPAGIKAAPSIPSLPSSPIPMPAIAAASHVPSRPGATVLDALTPNTSESISSMMNALAASPKGFGDLASFLAMANDPSKNDADDFVPLPTMHDMQVACPVNSVSDEWMPPDGNLGPPPLPPLGILTALPDGDDDWDDLPAVPLPLAHIYPLPAITEAASPFFVPEPSSLVLAFVGAPLLLIRRRRKIQGPTGTK